MNLAATRNSTSIADLVNSVPALSRRDLIERWSEHYGNPPAKSISTRLLVFAVAYALQVERYGRLSRRPQKELLRLAGSAGALHESQPPGDSLVSARRKRSARPRATSRQGTRFVRQWNGKSHVVEVVDKGFAWQGKTYRSLSAIATSITGNRWSGPRFFGLT
ncbi:MAG: DUF2924 domain-containing protein [Rhizobiales bacterium]|nr:DUF2924 domain-containing protein [Hyphomicrobiales bacterium]MBI3672235.1 DUF2924 domain-containing protein [Hyphomicrobiales bacterium]